MTGRQTISQNNWVKTTFDWINRSTFYRQILRFSEQKLGNLSRNVAEFRSVEIGVDRAHSARYACWQGGFFPFFYNWHELHQQGLIDGAEWKANRWRWL